MAGVDVEAGAGMHRAVIEGAHPELAVDPVAMHLAEDLARHAELERPHAFIGHDRHFDALTGSLRHPGRHLFVACAL